MQIAAAGLNHLSLKSKQNYKGYILNTKRKKFIMAIICPVCNNIYSDEYEYYLNSCPMETCNDEIGELIHVDCAIAPIAAEFNKKGWSIESVEFGSPTNQIKHPSYIQFSSFLLGDDMFTEKDLRIELDNIPCGWAFCVEDGHPMIKMDIYFGDNIERTQKFMKAWLDIAEFVGNMSELYY